MPWAGAAGTAVGHTDVHPAMAHIKGFHATTTTTTTTRTTTATTTTTNKDNHDVSHEREDTIALYEHFNPLPNRPITPIDINKLSELLVGHPDKGAVQFITDGLTHEFDIGYRGTYSSTRPRNLRSAREHAAAVSIAIRKELDRGTLQDRSGSLPLHTLTIHP